MTERTFDINCDLGESFGNWSLGNDEEVMPLVTSANVACGFHGGDPVTMERTVALAMRHGVAVGAHPGVAHAVRRALTETGREIATVGAAA
jgi:5-oxoprolinase (ATP-hydrolysing) subunit A